MILGDSRFHSEWYTPLKKITSTDDLNLFYNKLKQSSIKITKEGKKVNIGNTKILVDLTKLIFYKREEFELDEWRIFVAKSNNSDKAIYYVTINFIIKCIKDILDNIDNTIEEKDKDNEIKEEEVEEMQEAEEIAEEIAEEETENIEDKTEEIIKQDEPNDVEYEDIGFFKYFVLTTFFTTFAPLILYMLIIITLKSYDASYKTEYSNLLQNVVESFFLNIEEYFYRVVNLINK